MNILFLAYFPMRPIVGGIQRVTDILAEEFIKRGFCVNYLSLLLDSSSEKSSTITPQYYINVEKDDCWEEKINRLLENLKIEFIINQTPNAITNKALQVLKSKYKVISVIHTQPFLNDNISRKQIALTKTHNTKQLLFKWISYICPPIRAYIFGRYEKRNLIQTAALSNKVCFISNRFFTRILKHIPSFPREKMVAINNPNTFKPNEEPCDKENIILWVGRIENEVKNTIDFVKVWEQLYNIQPRWKSIIAGDGKDLDDIKNYIKRKKIKNIEVIGRCDNVQALYKKAKIVVVTSFSESWCMVLTEGLAHGCVVCAYNTYETIFDIIRKENGIITPPNPVIMAQKINEILTHSDIYNTLAQGTTSSIAKYDVVKIADEWIDLLSNIN